MDKICTQRLYSDVVDDIHTQPIPGRNLADKVKYLLIYWKRNHNKTTAQLIGEDIYTTIYEIIKQENMKNGP